MRLPTNESNFISSFFPTMQWGGQVFTAVRLTAKQAKHVIGLRNTFMQVMEKWQMLHHPN